MKKYFVYKFDVIGKIMIVEEAGFITDIDFERSIEIPKDSCSQETPLIKQTHSQLVEYFAGQRKYFELPLAPKGTDFQTSCWNAFLNIPYGETRSYQQIAVNVECPKGCRAVGMAANRNPIVIVIPCHRIIGTSGALVGFGGGLDAKKYLLEIERKYHDIQE